MFSGVATKNRIKHAARVGLIHFCICLCIAVLMAALVFGLWFPWPYGNLVGGVELFFLIVGVDIVCGPLLTFVLASPSKSKREFRVDLGFIVFIQIVALGYGLHAAAMSRPVHIVFEVDRFRVVTANEIDSEELSKAPSGLQKLPWTGPTLIGLRSARDSAEFLESIDLSLAGREPSLRPDWWQEYGKSLPKILDRAKPVSVLEERYLTKSDEIRKAVNSAKMKKSEMSWLPLTSSRKHDWVVLLDKKNGMPKGFIELDGF